MQRALPAVRLGVLLAAFLLFQDLSADWPTSGGGPERQGSTAESLPRDLSLAWRRHEGVPDSAWPRSGRLTFDRAYRLAVAGGNVYYGTHDGIVRALRETDGTLVWEYATEGPVRLAPFAWNGRVYVGSDDGLLYAFRGSDGDVLWKARSGPRLESVLGNERMISRWPVRGAPAVKDGIVYFASGLWPTEGVVLEARDAVTGELLWRNDRSGSIYTGQPHGGAFATSGTSAQGHLVVTESLVLLPTGRAVPAAFERGNGKFRYFHLQKHGQVGGAMALAFGNFFLNGGVVFALGDGARLARLGPGVTAHVRGRLVRAHAKTATVYRLDDEVSTDRKGRPQRLQKPRVVRSHPTAAGAHAVIVAGEDIVVGGDDRVTIIREGVAASPRSSVASRSIELPVDGVAWELAATGGRLFVSTDRGTIFTFARQPEETTPRKRPPVVHRQPLEHDVPREGAQQAAAAIAERIGVVRGYGVDYGADEGDLTIALLERNADLYVCAVETDPARVARVRDRLRRAGLYGSRASVHWRPDGVTGFPVGFANLVVSGRSLVSSAWWDEPRRRREVDRLLRPYGGAVAIGKTAELSVTQRGAPEGAGNWTHQYADPANTTCSGDEVRGPLTLAWYRDVAQRMTQRHGRAPAPLFFGGRLFSEGTDSIVAVDAYNGHFLWELPLEGILAAYDGDHLMGTAGTHGNYCVGPEGLFVRQADLCHRVNVTSGEIAATFPLPSSRAVPAQERTDEEQGRWGYVALEDGILFGSEGNPDHVVTYRYLPGGNLKAQLTESRAFFALDARSGRVLWKHTAKHSIRHNAIAIASGRVFLIDRPLALSDRRRGKADAPHPGGILYALDARTGDVHWRTDEDIFGTTLAVSSEHSVLLMSYQPTRFRLASEVGGRLAAYRVADGRRLWERRAEYASRPVINGATVYAQGGAWDLRYGESRPFPFSRSYGCGLLAGGKYLMVYRSATLGYFDVVNDTNTRDFGGLRPGCWINAIPAGGMVLVPDASAGCVCSYVNRAWVGLQGGH